MEVVCGGDEVCMVEVVYVVEVLYGGGGVVEVVCGGGGTW